MIIDITMSWNEFYAQYRKLHRSAIIVVYYLGSVRLTMDLFDPQFRLWTILSILWTCDHSFDFSIKIVSQDKHLSLTF